MTPANTVRVAAAQFHVGPDPDANLATCLRMMSEAAACGPDLIVFPEFCNHLSWYSDRQHCFDVSVRLGGPFLTAIADRARELGVFVVINCTVQREDGSATGSSLLYDRRGQLLIDNTKQIYIGHENDYLEKAREEGPVVETELGRIGLYACMDGVINETPRCLALNGAQLMLNSLNSFATDEASLHIPVRAAENKVWVVAANKVGPLVPEEMVEGISAATGIPRRFLSGAGESQIVAPDGTVLAKASRDREEFVYADIEVSLADDKCRPDGTDIFASRRPELYRPITADPAGQALPAMNGAQEVGCAIVQLADSDSLDDAAAAVQQAVAAGAELVCLPPLAGDLAEPAAAAVRGGEIIDRLAALAGGAYLATALVRPCANGYQYGAALINRDGLALFQPQVHHSLRHGFSLPGDEFVSLDLPLGRVAVVTSDDSLYPETFRLLALAGVAVALVPLSPLEDWELQTGLLERSAENRINLLVAPDTGRHGPAFATALQTDFTVMTEWQERKFDGLLSQPEWYRYDEGSGVFLVGLRPANAAHKVVSLNTDLLASRPWRVAGAISR